MILERFNENRKDIEDGFALAEKINNLNEKLAYHLQAPHRLSSDNLAEIVRKLAAEAKTVSAKSDLIKKKHVVLITCFFVLWR